MKILLVGLGSIGQRHLRNLATLGCTDLWAVRVRNRPLPELPPGVRLQTFADLEEALTQGPEVVFVTNPTSLHVPTALAAARRGCHLFIEKPLGHTLEGVAELAEEVERRRLTVLVGCSLRFHPGLLQVKALLDSGRIGSVIAARLQVGEYLPGWHPWEDYREGYSARRDLGGGVILTLIHELDYSRWLFGDPTRVVAFGGKRTSLEVDVEDVAAILLEFPHGPVVQLHMDYIQRPPSRTCQIVGEAGQIIWDYYGEGVRLYGADSGAWTLFPHPPGLERNTVYLDEVRHFLDCLGGRATPAVKLADGLRVLEMAMAARTSLEKGEVVWLR